MSFTLQTIEQALGRHKARKKRLRRFMRRSAVAMILRQQGPQQHSAGLDILMIKRAERAGDPWSGHMAFPGGKMDAIDRHGFDVARRETEEETGLKLGAGDRCIGRLSERLTRPQWRRRPMMVSPYVFALQRAVVLTPNYEVAEALWLPLTYFMNPANREQMVWSERGVTVKLPCYNYQGRCIWGVSLMMLDELTALLRA